KYTTNTTHHNSYPTRRSSDLTARENIIASHLKEQRMENQQFENQEWQTPRQHYVNTDPREQQGQQGQQGYYPQSMYVDPREKIQDRKSTRLNSSHQIISYAVF